MRSAQASCERGKCINGKTIKENRCKTFFRSLHFGFFFFIVQSINKQNEKLTINTTSCSEISLFDWGGFIVSNCTEHASTTFKFSSDLLERDSIYSFVVDVAGIVIVVVDIFGAGIYNNRTLI